MCICLLQASDAYHVFTSGQAKIQQGLLHEGYELISEALNLLNNVYGAMHPEIAACARLLARLSYIMGDYSEVSAVFLIISFICGFYFARCCNKKPFFRHLASTFYASL